jgi:hypothetical protein
MMRCPQSPFREPPRFHPKGKLNEEKARREEVPTQPNQLLPDLRLDPHSTLQTITHLPKKDQQSCMTRDNDPVANSITGRESHSQPAPTRSGRPIKAVAPRPSNPQTSSAEISALLQLVRLLARRQAQSDIRSVKADNDDSVHPVLRRRLHRNRSCDFPHFSQNGCVPRYRDKLCRPSPLSKWHS